MGRSYAIFSCDHNVEINVFFGVYLRVSASFCFQMVAFEHTPTFDSVKMGGGRTEGGYVQDSSCWYTPNDAQQRCMQVPIDVLELR